jgi:hypothetical protein
MVYALQKFRHYLLGIDLYFMLITWPLCTWLTSHRFIVGYLGWLLLFLEYDFKILYKLGKSHLIVDALCKLLTKQN